MNFIYLCSQIKSNSMVIGRDKEIVELNRLYSSHQTLVTTYGLKYNEYSGIFQNVVTLEDLLAI